MNTPDTEGSVEELMRDLRHLASPYAETLSDMQRTSQFILLVNRLDKAMRTPDTSSCTSCNGWGANGGASCNTCTKNTPDTEFDSDKEVVGSDCLCVLGSKKHNPECEYATPDIEWEKVVEEFYLNFTDIEKQELDTPSWNHNGVTPYLVEQWIRTLLTSRDTYWKERVRKEVEDMSHNIKIEIAGISGILNGSAVSDSGQAHTAQMKLGNILEALDTLLEKFTNEDNLK